MRTQNKIISIHGKTTFMEFNRLIINVLYSWIFKDNILIIKLAFYFKWNGVITKKNVMLGEMFHVVSEKLEIKQF